MWAIKPFSHRAIPGNRSSETGDGDRFSSPLARVPLISTSTRSARKHPDSRQCHEPTRAVDLALRADSFASEFHPPTTCDTQGVGTVSNVASCEASKVHVFLAASHHYSVGLEDARNTPIRRFKAVARVQIPLGPPLRTASWNPVILVACMSSSSVESDCLSWREVRLRVMVHAIHSAVP